MNYIFCRLVFSQAAAIFSKQKFLLRYCYLVFLKFDTMFQKNKCKKGDSGTGFFSCEFCEISKNIFFAEHIWVTASEISLLIIRECKRIANGFLVISGGKKLIYSFNIRSEIWRQSLWIFKSTVYWLYSEISSQLCLRQFLKYHFLFHLKALFVFKTLKFLS